MTVKPGDDLSYYLGPAAKHATAEQCRQLERIFAAAHAAARAGQPASEKPT